MPRPRQDSPVDSSVLVGSSSAHTGIRVDKPDGRSKAAMTLVAVAVAVVDTSVTE